MKALIEYVANHTTRGDCQCGKCVVNCGTIEKPSGHTVNLTFFEVGMKGNPDAVSFKTLLKEASPDLYAVAEGAPITANFMQIGGVIGDQGLGLLTMALGHLLGVWYVASPDTEYPELSQKEKMEKAGMGGVVIMPTNLAKAVGMKR